METKVTAGQSLFDIAVQESGDVETVFDIAACNDLSVTGEPEAGRSLAVDGARNKQIADYYRVRNIRPATFSDRETVTLTGIGYMSIEENNIVS